MLSFSSRIPGGMRVSSLTKISQVLFLSPSPKLKGLSPLFILFSNKTAALNKGTILSFAKYILLFSHNDATNVAYLSSHPVTITSFTQPVFLHYASSQHYHYHQYHHHYSHFIAKGNMFAY